MQFTFKRAQSERKLENLTNASLLLVAFPELEGNSFSSWLRSTAAFFLAPVRHMMEVLLVDSWEVIRGILGGRR